MVIRTYSTSMSSVPPVHVKSVHVPRNLIVIFLFFTCPFDKVSGHGSQFSIVPFIDGLHASLYNLSTSYDTHPSLLVQVGFCTESELLMKISRQAS